MSSTPATQPTSDYHPSLLARGIATMSGTTGKVAKWVLLALLNAMVIWAIGQLFAQGKPLWALITLAVIALLDLVYLVPGLVPAKFIVPGTVFLIAYLVIPIFFTVTTAFQIYSTGHVLTKDDAIASIQLQSLQPTGVSYLMAPARDAEGNLVLLLVDDETGTQAVGTPDGLTELPEGTLAVDEVGTVTSTSADYTVITGGDLFALDAELAAFTVPVEDGSAIRPEGITTAVVLKPTLAYDPETDTFRNIETGVVYSDNEKGSYVSADGAELEPGWRTFIGLDNLTAVFTDPLVRGPFFRTFLWTVVFATSAVFFSFAIGLFLAITLDKPGMRFLRTYRSLLVIPYAIPGFLMLLVWAGLLNDDFGVINKLLPGGLDRPWLFDPFWAKVSVIMVTTWLTVPYFMLVSLGALQSIPSELTEAARVDGASKLQVFRRVTLPLLMIVVAPLLIASFAFNFNNFNNIYLLTAGGPAAEDQSVAGATDILISYTYKLAFQAGKGQDYGLASAVSIYVFLIVATISGVAFWRTKALEGVQ
jgi:arabinogalactan oligomer / maltooligosaccharide transport system permease protein